MHMTPPIQAPIQTPAQRNSARERSLRQRNEYVEQHLYLVRAIARGLAKRLPASIELDDMIQAGSMGLIRAAERYKRSMHVEFRFYASWRIRGEILELARRKNYHFLVDLPINEEALEVEEKVVSIEERIEKRQRVETMQRAFHLLGDEAQAMLRSYYAGAEPASVAAVGEEFGMREGKAGERLRDARRRLRENCAMFGLRAAA